MPFLFVDYEQGSGGEYFAGKLSQSYGCIPLRFDQFDSGRSKAYDLFDQEFLTDYPNIKPRLPWDENYELVLTHQNVNLAQKLLGEIRSIRITPPIQSDSLWNYYRYQRIIKVLLSPLSNRIFLGEIKLLAKTATNPNFLKQINGTMDSLDLILISKNIEPSEENKSTYIKDTYVVENPEELDFKYDLIIPYRDLFYNTEKIIDDVRATFGIEIREPWLDAYRRNYEDWLSQARSHDSLLL